MGKEIRSFSLFFFRVIRNFRGFFSVFLLRALCLFAPSAFPVFVTVYWRIAIGWMIAAISLATVNVYTFVFVFFWALLLHETS